MTIFGGLVFVSSTVISHIVSVKGHSARTLYGLAVQQIVTVQLAPFVKAHYVLTVADATVLLINRRSAHTDVRLQKHASIFLASRTLYG